MDSLGIVGLTRRLVDIDSTTGKEGECGRVLADSASFVPDGTVCGGSTVRGLIQLTSRPLPVKSSRSCSAP